MNKFVKREGETSLDQGYQSGPTKQQASAVSMSYDRIATALE